MSQQNVSKGEKFATVLSRNLKNIFLGVIRKEALQVDSPWKIF